MCFVNKVIYVYYVFLSYFVYIGYCQSRNIRYPKQSNLTHAGIP